jgi:beta-lactamase superfamily II metal-dependent hydrolase
MRSLRRAAFLFAVSVAVALGSSFALAPPRLDIYHFDVNTGDATLIITPDGHAVLIDAGDRGRGNNPIQEFLKRAEEDGRLASLDYFIATHYDTDHIGGADELFNGGWYPAIQVFDRGDTLLPPFDPNELSTCQVDLNEAEQVAEWGTAEHCGQAVASCQIVEYILAAEEGGERETLEPGQVLTLDHGVEIEVLVVNARDLDSQSVNVMFPGRRSDCASNDLSIGLLVKYGDFRYLIAGDLTGDPSEEVADVEELIKDDAPQVDVYHINHHGSETSSSLDFMEQIRPRIAIVSNGPKFGHPRRKVIEERILALTPKPAVYLTNRNQNTLAWQPPAAFVADDDLEDYDGTIQISVWRRSYRVFRWRNGSPIDDGDRFSIKDREE